MLEIEEVGTRSFTILTMCDWHVPYHSAKALAVAFEFARVLQPQVIVVHEAHDFYSLSKFAKDPGRALQLQEELDVVRDYLGWLREICPHAKILLLRANHTDRLQKYLWSQAVALSGLRALQLDELLGLKDMGIEYVNSYVHKDVPDAKAHILFKHGDLVSKHSGYTARAELDREGMSGVSGHTHRLSAHYSRKRGGSYVWIEAGCLCDLNPQYINGTANWQNGVCLVEYKPNGHFVASPIPIIDNELVWGDIRITPERTIT